MISDSQFIRKCEIQKIEIKSKQKNRTKKDMCKLGKIRIIRIGKKTKRQENKNSTSNKKNKKEKILVIFHF